MGSDYLPEEVICKVFRVHGAIACDKVSHCHEPDATGSLALAPVPLSPLSPCGLSSFPLPQPRSGSALRRLNRSPPYRSGSDIPDCWPV